VVTRQAVSRPLQLRELGVWKPVVWVPRSLCRSEKEAARELGALRLPIAWPEQEFPRARLNRFADLEPALTCGSFLDARAALEQQGLAAILPDFLTPARSTNRFWKIPLPGLEAPGFHYLLAWNPRLLRLNPHAARRRDALGEALMKLSSSAT
jgi:hypothetical protein